ncbi:AAEL017131-PA [Aedes aegypti]|uniref:AAEL017131-PA n=1 Tax=Aedes aegypti TaxID=7159 RepID=J9HT32_AEDAE|nr:AAEL017131-PA [Aedes aegypti]
MLNTRCKPNRHKYMEENKPSLQPSYFQLEAHLVVTLPLHVIWF